MNKLTLNQIQNLSIDNVIDLYRNGYRLEEYPKYESLAPPIVDQFTNFGKVTVSTGYDSIATSILLSSGNGSKLPDPSTGQYNLVWWNATDYFDPTDDPNREIIRVTAKSGDTLTITRGQEGTTPSNKNIPTKVYKMVNALTSKSIIDLQTYSQSTVTTHAALTSSIHNFDTSGNSPPQTHGKTKHDPTTIDGGFPLPTGQLPIHGSAQHTGIIGDHQSNLSSIGTNTHSQIDTHISSILAHGLGTGLDASKPASPSVGQTYLATDTLKDYKCYVAGTWQDPTILYAGATPYNLQGSPALMNSNDAELIFYNSTMAKLKGIAFNAPFVGDMRITFDIRYSGGAAPVYGQIYKNGVPWGTLQTYNNSVYTTFTQDFTGLTLLTGTSIELWGYTTAGGTHNGRVRNFRLYYNIGVPSTNS